MNEKKVASLKIVFEDGSDYSVACEKGLDKDELANYIERAFKPAEPLIKDEKTRKAVRAWAELHKLENVFYFEYSIHEELSYLKSNDTGVVIDIVALPELKDGKIYTIAELCGEEEE